MKKSLVCYILSLVVALSVPIMYFVRESNAEPNVDGRTILTLWHVDTFEGGINSRAGFLKNRAAEFERKFGGSTLISVETHTIVSIKAALDSGKYPDLISYGRGVDIPTSRIFINKCWCRGRYLLIFRGGSSDKIKKLIISSQGDYTAPALAFVIEGGFSAESYEIIDSSLAYAKIDAYTALLGTQRDYYRLKNKGGYTFVPLEKYNDLFQYIALTNERNYDLASAFIEYLTSREAQEKLTNIGMSSPYFDIYGGELSYTDFQKETYSISPFEAELYAHAARLSLSAIGGDASAREKIQNIFK